MHYIRITYLLIAGSFYLYTPSPIFPMSLISGNQPICSLWVSSLFLIWWKSFYHFFLCIICIVFWFHTQDIPSSNPKSQRFILILSSVGFIILYFTFRLMICFWLNFCIWCRICYFSSYGYPVVSVPFVERFSIPFVPL